MTERAAEGLGPSSDDGGRDRRLGLFAIDGELDGAAPSGELLGILESLAVPSGPRGRRFAGSAHDEDAGMLAAALALEGRAAWLKLALVARLIRRHAPEIPGGGLPGPSQWDIGLAHEVAAVLRISWQAAFPLAELAWQLEARLPGTGGLLRDGVLSYITARIVAEEFSVLDDGLAAEAEKRLLDHDLGADGMTPGAIRRLCQRIADTVDPRGAAERREQKQRDQARVTFYREHGGAAAVYGTGLPPDAALMSESNIQKRALEYKSAGIRERMDCLRVLALVDLTNGVDVPRRLTMWRAEQAERERTGADDPGRREWEREQAGSEARARYGDRHPFPDEPPFRDEPSFPDEPPFPEEPPFPDAAPFPEEPDDLDDRDLPDDGGEGGSPRDHPDEFPDPGGDDPGDASGPGDASSPGDGYGPGDGPHGGGGLPGGGPVPGSGPVPAGVPDPGLPALVNLTLPLATLFGQAERPGEAPGYGSLDPALTRDLAAASAQSPRSRFCMTFTDEEGRAAAHACARLIRGTGPGKSTGKTGERGGAEGNGGAGGGGGTRDGPPGTGWDLTRDTTRPGPDGGYGAWLLSLPSGARYRVAMHAIPLHECDHAYGTDAYRPSALLRHLVEVRDGECTFVGCSHPASRSDFEHAIPHHRGGPTCACNGGARSRRCHQVKQTDWTVTQPRPGWHRWEAPSGRSYTKGPKAYPD